MLLIRKFIKNVNKLNHYQEMFMPTVNRAGRLISTCLKRTGSGGDLCPVCRFARIPD